MVDKPDFIGKSALKSASTKSRLTGLLVKAEPHIGAEVRIDGKRVGRVSAGADSPYLKSGIGIAMLDAHGLDAGVKVTIGCIDGEYHDGQLAELPLYDRACNIPRGKLVDIPVRS